MASLNPQSPEAPLQKVAQEPMQMGTAFFSGPQSPRNSSYYSIVTPRQRLKTILVIERSSPKEVTLGFT